MQGSAMLIDAAFDGRTVDLPIGQVAELRLNENPTTGYRWAVESGPGETCAIVGDSFRVPNDPASAGQGGEHRWQIEARREGACDLVFASRRGFEPGAPAAATFRVHLRVTPKL